MVFSASRKTDLIYRTAGENDAEGVRTTLNRFISLLAVCVIQENHLFFLSSVSDLAFACMLYKIGDDRGVSVSGKMRCVSPSQRFIHQSVGLMYKVQSLTMVSEPVGESLQNHDIRKCKVLDLD